MVGSTAYHQETIQVNDGIDEEVRCTNLLNPDTSPTWQEKESVKEENRAIEDDFEDYFEEKQVWPIDHQTTVRKRQMHGTGDSTRRFSIDLDAR